MKRTDDIASLQHRCIRIAHSRIPVRLSQFSIEIARIHSPELGLVSFFTILQEGYRALRLVINNLPIFIAFSVFLAYNGICLFQFNALNGRILMYYMGDYL